MDISLPSKFQFLFRPKRIKIMYGGRGGAKTVSVSTALVCMAAQKAMRILCLREFQNSIDDSVHSALKGVIEDLGLGNVFTSTINKIDSVHGSAFRYGQLARNLASIKSKYDFDIAWIEEAETVSQQSLDVLEPTLRKSGSELWATFNPDDENGAIWQMVKPHLKEIEKNGFYEDEGIYIVKVNLEDNPFAPQELIDSSEKMKREDFLKWKHIFGGDPYGDYSESIIKPEWVEAAIDARMKLKGFEAVGVKSEGFDPADNGGDAKATVMRHGSVITKGEEWTIGEIEEGIIRAFDNAYEWRAEHIVYDSDGIGRGVKVGLAERIEGKNITVTPYGGNDAVDNPHEVYKDDKTYKETFKNKRAQYYWLLRDRFLATYNAIEKGIYTDPQDMISLSSDIEGLPALKAELIQIRRKRGANSFIQIESKEDMKKRGVQSPNMTDALVMSFANPLPEPLVDLTFESEFG